MGQPFECGGCGQMVRKTNPYQVFVDIATGKQHLCPNLSPPKVPEKLPIVKEPGKSIQDMVNDQIYLKLNEIIDFLQNKEDR